MKVARSLACVLALSIWTTAALAAPPRDLGRTARPAKTLIVDNGNRIDINNLSVVVTNTGSFAFDKINGSSGLEFPKGTGKTAVFAAGLWVGARVAGGTRIAVAEYSDEYGPGTILANGSPDDRSRPEYKVYKLNRVYPDNATRDAALADYNTGAVPYGAPAVTVNTDGSLTILGDQMLWAVYNDADPQFHVNGAGTTSPLGIEVQQTTFAFDRLGALGNTVFIRYRFINKGTNTLDSMYVSQWSDPDLGGFTDDLVGCDVPRSLGFCYNADNNDGQYADRPPAVGYDFFKGPVVGGTPLGMSSFNKYINGTDPDDASKTYNYMKGLQDDGNVLVNPVTGQPTTYFVSGDPVTSSGWLDDSPADRRLMLSSGPFTMAPGDTQEVVTAIIVAQSKDRLASISLLRFYDDIAQSAFDQDFDLASPPISPTVIATPEEGAVQLTWTDASENYDQAPYNFEGYVVYQGASIAGPFVRLATFDLSNGIQTVLDNDFDEESGIALPKVKALGNDRGLEYSLRVTQDRVRGGPLNVGSRYYYAVTAYSVGVGQTPQVLESSPQVITVIPQTPPADTDMNRAVIASGPTHGQTVPATATTDVVQITVVDRNQLVDASYRVGYEPDINGDLTWYLERTIGTTTVRVLTNQTNFSGDAAYVPVDGLQVKVIGADFGTPNGVLLRTDYIDGGPNPPGYVGFGGALGLHYFAGSADYTYEMQFHLAGLSSKLNPADPSPFRNVEIRFTGGAAGQKAYRYIQSHPAPRTYPFVDYVDVPFTVWDTENNRQLNAGLFEFAGAPAPDPTGAWEASREDEDPFTRREWLYVFASDYSGNTPDPFYTTTYPNARTYADSLDFMYVFWPAQALDGNGNPIPVDAGDIVRFTRFIRTTNDFFTFTTRAPDRASASVGQSEMLKIKAVPNPYFNHSTFELSQFRRELKFTHLPQRCTIRLFNLAGDLVRILEKNDSSSQVIWDLETRQGLPVGSGIYIFHVDAPGIGTHVGKVAVFMEKERLNNF